MNLINKRLGKGAAGLITLYQWTISPDKGIFSYFLKGRICSHEPHCSKYGKECMQRYGFRPGVVYAGGRVLECRPAMQKTYDPTHYRVVFFSGSPIGVPFLEELQKDPRFDIAGVVAMPDKPIGRGQHLQKNIIKETAEQLGIATILQPTTWKKTKDAVAYGHIKEQLTSLKADYFIVISYGSILPKEILDIPYFASINVHGSILPAYRGASPLQSVFLSNEKETGLTIMKMDEKMDEGDIVSTYKFPLPFSRTSKELFEKVMSVGPKFLADRLWDLGKGHMHSKPQDHTKATYCSKIEKDDGKIDLWTTPLSEVYATYRAYALRPKTWTIGPETYGKLANKNIIIETLLLDENKYNTNMNQPVLSKNNTLNPAISLLELKPEGKKKMDWQSFKNGYLQ